MVVRIAVIRVIRVIRVIAVIVLINYPTGQLPLAMLRSTVATAIFHVVKVNKSRKDSVIEGQRFLLFMKWAGN
jgi:hypothetical protein